jgi:hypothetical protein
MDKAGQILGLDLLCYHKTKRFFSSQEEVGILLPSKQSIKQTILFGINHRLSSNRKRPQ